MNGLMDYKVILQSSERVHIGEGTNDCAVLICTKQGFIPLDIDRTIVIINLEDSPPKHVVSVCLSASNIVSKSLQATQDTTVDLDRSQTVLMAQICAHIEGLSTFQVPFFRFLDLMEPRARACLPRLLLISLSKDKLLMLLKRFSSLCLTLIFSILRWCFSLAFSNPEIFLLIPLIVAVIVRPVKGFT